MFGFTSAHWAPTNISHLFYSNVGHTKYLAGQHTCSHGLGVDERTGVILLQMNALRLCRRRADLNHVRISNILIYWSNIRSESYKYAPETCKWTIVEASAPIGAWPRELRLEKAEAAAEDDTQTHRWSCLTVDFSDLTSKTMKTALAGEAIAITVWH